ncbi:MAG: NADH:ubiquinone reductase (Na(+)-transporting) subunit E [FCB group bacterium]|nr:NADH:ubiquinone reductase (Na(+)-transporting) subunit E [FCB group bacterium]
MFEHYLDLAIKAIFVENIILGFFLGICPFLAISKKVSSSIGMGLAVTFVMTTTSPINWMVNNFLLKEGALSWLGFPEIDLSYLSYIIFIAVIAATVQLIEMIIDRFSPTLHQQLGIFLPLIAVNCAILGVSLFLIERDYTLAESTVYGFGSGIGWFLAITSMAAMRHKLRYSNVPAGLRGLGITMILTGLLSMSFMAFSGIDL